jgi:hypothetical protein
MYLLMMIINNIPAPGPPKTNITFGFVDAMINDPFEI